jgi:hypothetical protein
MRFRAAAGLRGQASHHVLRAATALDYVPLPTVTPQDTRTCMR